MIILKYFQQYVNRLKEEESTEILKILGLITNMEVC